MNNRTWVLLFILFLIIIPVGVKQLSKTSLDGAQTISSEGGNLCLLKTTPALYAEKSEKSPRGYVPGGTTNVKLLIVNVAACRSAKLSGFDFSLEMPDSDFSISNPRITLADGTYVEGTIMETKGDEVFVRVNLPAPIIFSAAGQKTEISFAADLPEGLAGRLGVSLLEGHIVNESEKAFLAEKTTSIIIVSGN